MKGGLNSIRRATGIMVFAEAVFGGLAPARAKAKLRMRIYHTQRHTSYGKSSVSIKEKKHEKNKK